VSLECVTFYLPFRSTFSVAATDLFIFFGRFWSYFWRCKFLWLKAWFFILYLFIRFRICRC
jgi:hypothetical protein